MLVVEKCANNVRVFALSCAFLFLLSFQLYASVWQPLMGSTTKETIRIVYVHPKYPSLIFYGTEEMLIRFDLDKTEERAVLFPQGGTSEGVNDIFASAHSDDLY